MRPDPSKWAHRLGAFLMPIAFMALGALMLGIIPDVGAQGTKRLATAMTGLPWDGCSDVEGYVADELGQYTVQSARCNGSIQTWLLKRDKDEVGDGGRPLVIDQLTVRALPPGQTFSAAPYCRVHGREVRWVATYDWNKRKRITGRSGGIVEAWKANLQAGRLEKVPRSLIREAVCTANPDE